MMLVGRKRMFSNITFLSLTYHCKSEKNFLGITLLTNKEASFNVKGRIKPVILRLRTNVYGQMTHEYMVV